MPRCLRSSVRMIVSSTTPRRTYTLTEYCAAPLWRGSCSLVSQHDYTFRNKAQLLTEIQRSTRKGGGLSVRALKESWKDAPTVIEELEKEGEVLVTRTNKDGQMRMVFWNEVKPDEESGGAQVEQGMYCISAKPLLD
jgi:hypothetical protein